MATVYQAMYVSCPSRFQKSINYWFDQFIDFFAVRYDLDSHNNHEYDAYLRVGNK